MVGGDAIDHAVLQRAAQRRDVGSLTERRIHLGVRVILFAGVVGQRQMMRRHFSGDSDAPVLRVTDDRDRAARRHVAEMDMPAGQFGEQHIARNHDRFGRGGDALEAESRRHETLMHHATRRERRILAMIGDRNAEGARVFERGAHQVTRDHGLTVVRDRDRAGAHHLTEFGEPLTFLTDRDRADRMHAREGRAS